MRPSVSPRGQDRRRAPLTRVQDQRAQNPLDRRRKSAPALRMRSSLAARAAPYGLRRICEKNAVVVPPSTARWSLDWALTELAALLVKPLSYPIPKSIRPLLPVHVDRGPPGKGRACECLAKRLWCMKRSRCGRCPTRPSPESDFSARSSSNPSNRPGLRRCHNLLSRAPGLPPRRTSCLASECSYEVAPVVCRPALGEKSPVAVSRSRCRRHAAEVDRFHA